MTLSANLFPFGSSARQTALKFPFPSWHLTFNLPIVLCTILFWFFQQLAQSRSRTLKLNYCMLCSIRFVSIFYIIDRVYIDFFTYRHSLYKTVGFICRSQIDNSDSLALQLLMEAVTKPKCKFFKEGQTNSCKNGDGCHFNHDKGQSESEAQRLDRHKYVQKEGIKFEIKEKNPKQPEKEEKPHYHEHKVEIGDPQVKKKIAYLTGLTDSLKKNCSKCSKNSHLVITSCGCQSICQMCVSKTEKCPRCGGPFLKDLFIGASV